LRVGSLAQQEMEMKFRWIVVAAAALSVIAAEPALARTKHHHAKVRCVDQPKQFSWDLIWTLRPDPQPNGCSPPAYDGGKFVGQDPDRNIRHQLRRDPDEFYVTR
jgi:hypothetical protein